MQVYAVWDDSDYESRLLEGLYATEELAEAVALAANEKDRPPWRTTPLTSYWAEAVDVETELPAELVKPSAEELAAERERLRQEVRAPLPYE